MGSQINHRIITWARERNGFSVDDLAHAMKRKPSEVERWEEGTDTPTYATLEDNACDEFHVECIGLEEFLNREGVKY